MRPEISLYQPSKRIFARVLKRCVARVPGGGLILDLGCGFGDYAVYVSEKLNRRVVGLDIDAEICQIAAAAVRGSGVLGIHLYGGGAFPFRDRVFDLIYACEVIEHVPDDLFFLSEIRRTLKEGGELLLSTPNAARLPFAKEKHPDHQRHYLYPELKAKLEISGFSVTGRYYRGHRLMSAYDIGVVGLAKRFIRKGQRPQAVHTIWRLEEQPLLTKMLWRLYSLIFNQILSAIIIGEFELCKHVEANDMILCARKTA
jgi:SAM-dependent methyltransferase